MESWQTDKGEIKVKDRQWVRYQRRKVGRQTRVRSKGRRLVDRPGRVL